MFNPSDAINALPIFLIFLIAGAVMPAEFQCQRTSINPRTDLERRCTTSAASMSEDAVGRFEEAESGSLKVKLLQTDLAKHATSSEASEGVDTQHFPESLPLGKDGPPSREQSEQLSAILEELTGMETNLTDPTQSFENLTIEELALLEISSSLTEMSSSELTTALTDVIRATSTSPEPQEKAGVGTRDTLLAPHHWRNMMFMTLPVSNGLRLVSIIVFALAGLSVFSVHLLRSRRNSSKDEEPSMIQLDQFLAHNVTDKPRGVSSATTRKSPLVGTTFMLPIAPVSEDVVGCTSTSFEIVAKPAAWALRAALRRGTSAGPWEQLELVPDVQDADSMSTLLLCEPVADDVTNIDSDTFKIVCRNGQALGNPQSYIETPEPRTEMMPIIQRLHKQELKVSMSGLFEYRVTMSATGHSAVIRKDGEDVACASGDSTCLRVEVFAVVSARDALQLLASVIAVLAFDIGNVIAIKLTQKSL